MASGFFNETGNQANLPFALIAVGKNGSVTTLPVVNGIAKPLATNGAIDVFPNPVAGNELIVGINLFEKSILTATNTDGMG